MRKAFLVFHLQPPLFLSSFFRNFHYFFISERTKVAVSEGIPAEDLMEDIEESGTEEDIKQLSNAESTSNTCSAAESTSNLYSNAESISNICLNVESTVSTPK